MILWHTKQINNIFIIMSNITISNNIYNADNSIRKNIKKGELLIEHMIDELEDNDAIIEINNMTNAEKISYLHHFMCFCKSFETLFEHVDNNTEKISEYGYIIIAKAAKCAYDMYPPFVDDFIRKKIKELVINDLEKNNTIVDDNVVNAKLTKLFDEDSRQLTINIITALLQ